MNLLMIRDMSLSIAIECSQRCASVALRDAAGETLEEDLADPPRSGDDLLPALKRLIDRSGGSPRDISMVGVSIGPGSFTGIRIAVTVARTLALTNAAAVVGVPSALVALASAPAAGETMSGATDHGPDERTVLAVLAVKGDEFWATEARRGDELWSWRMARPPAIIEAAAQPTAHLAAIVADQFLPRILRARAEASGIPVFPLAPRAAACLELAQRHHAAHGADDPAALLPLYPRRPEAVRLWEARMTSRTSDRTD